MATKAARLAPSFSPGRSHLVSPRDEHGVPRSQSSFVTNTTLSQLTGRLGPADSCCHCQEYAEHVLVFGIAQPLALSSLPFEVPFTLLSAAPVADGDGRLLHWRGPLSYNPSVRASRMFQEEIQKMRHSSAEVKGISSGDDHL
ncbi:hypothetical protein GOODEAATRI_011919 [Goodea atripinnis]|uniref:Uncharacterized protein n=1 Tax=Goodea atripinnis TaxID=208336 RepID=A0ABV0NTX2_9TELE